MSKKVIGLIVVLTALAMVAPVSAKGPRGGQKGQSLTALTDAEMQHITYMREEEKLARDVYLTLFEKYGVSVFENIGNSEQRHMDALKRLINKYGIEDPADNQDVGEFTEEQGFSDLYAELVARGERSYCDALQVGIDIEVLDIADIELVLTDEDVAAPDVIRVLNNLLNGSYNHLNAFTSRFTAAGCQ